MKKYSKDHEWIEVNGNIGTIGISDYAQEQLGDVVFVSLLVGIDEDVLKGDEIAEIESVKSVSQVYAPVDGKIVEFNKIYEDESKSGILNEQPYGEGWIIKIEISNASQLDDLMDDAQYQEFIKTL
jgi:glycine cleavage system H protein